MSVDQLDLEYLGACVATDSTDVNRSGDESIPGNMKWVESAAFPRYEGLAANSVILGFRTSDLDAVLREFRELERVRQNAHEHRTAVVEYDGVPIRIEESPASHTKTSQYRYHSFWIPRSEAGDQDVRLAEAKMYVNNRQNPFGIGWVRYDADAPYDDVILSVPHVALAVDDLERAVEGHKLLIPPKQTQSGLRISFVECQGFPIEFIEVDAIAHPNGV